MATIKRQYDFVAAVNVEFDDGKQYRIEILSENSGGIIQIVRYVAEVYQRRWPSGVLVKTVPGKDTRFRQHWGFIEDFPHIEGSDVDQVRAEAIQRLLEYATEYQPQSGGRPQK